MFDLEKHLLDKERRNSDVNQRLRGFQFQLENFKRGTWFQGDIAGLKNHLFSSFDSGYMKDMKSILSKIDKPLLYRYENSVMHIIAQIG